MLSVDLYLYLYQEYTLIECAMYTAGKIHLSEETKFALDNTCVDGFDVEVRGEIDVKVRRRYSQVNNR